MKAGPSYLARISVLLAFLLVTLDRHLNPMSTVTTREHSCSKPVSYGQRFTVALAGQHPTCNDAGRPPAARQQRLDHPR
jgi:hypothetical protein